DDSRTFALTIPQLPGALCVAVGNAYLLCRIADTIEDEPTMSAQVKEGFGDQFVEVIAGTATAEDFAAELGKCLSSSALPAEHDLIRQTARVIRITHSLSMAKQKALKRCVRIMTRQMMEFQQTSGVAGLADMPAMDRYCYAVAGVVGEMLTDLFCDHSPLIKARRDRLMPLALSFGQGLQMTNILKDIWEDRSRGACWLPRDVFAAHGVDLSTVAAGQDNMRMMSGIRELVGIARQHLDKALKYILLIPVEETGIRRHCLWALGMAVLTLRRIAAIPSYAEGKDVKISRRNVKMVIMATNLTTRSDFALRLLFSGLSRGLP
ncbi:MAG: phytoene/squalene synthase family protein, partial [Rhodobacteraceae bacterium]|nr:phytoene/squalene synthase family protein [Paracoccaceae bacterium]